ncbi:MAG: ATP-binding cassette domain-containing protein [Acidimicrobiales bacterium]
MSIPSRLPPELWKRRDYIVQVPLNELRVQNAHTLLGNVWLLLNPVLSVGVYYLVFGLILNVKRGQDDYIVFLTIGVFVFFYSQRAILAGAGSIGQSIGLIRAMRFPRRAPLGTRRRDDRLPPHVVGHARRGVAYGNLPTWRWILLLFIFAMQILMAAGGSFVVARMNHKYGDLENTLPFVFRLLFYMSGALPVERFVNETFRRLLRSNPLYDYISLWRWAPPRHSGRSVRLARRARVGGDRTRGGVPLLPPPRATTGEAADGAARRVLPQRPRRVHDPRTRLRVRDRLRGSVSKGRSIHAVRGVNLDIEQGESIGLIGANGSGKSTLLRTIAGLLPATRGQVLVHSLPALLGVNAVLRPRA